jgi:hypothetical protein
MSHLLFRLVFAVLVCVALVLVMKQLGLLPAH